MTKPRPTGHDEKEYQGYKKWSNRQWAWEFLRRSESFKRACLALGTNPSQEQQQQVADEFGLLEFRDYRRGYSDGASRARFLATSVKFKARISETDPQHYRRAMRVGEVAVVFDLNDFIENPKLLDKKLRTAKNVLRRSAEKLQGKPLPKVGQRVRDPDKLLTHLRILDLKAKDVSNAAIAEKFFKSVLEDGMSNQEKAEKAKDAVAKARDLAKEGHIKILGWHEKVKKHLKGK